MSSTDPVFFLPARSPKPPLAYASHQAHNNVGTHQPGRTPPVPAAPTQLQRWRVPVAARPPWGPGAMQPWPPGTPPPSGSIHRWFPAVVPESPISVSKRRSNCRNLDGRRWVRTTGLACKAEYGTDYAQLCALVHALELRKHAGRCPEVPGVVCTVVPASGSRSSLLTLRIKSELGSACPACRTSIIRSL